MDIKDIPGYEGLYRISDDGAVFRADGVEMAGSVNSYGYRVVSLTKDMIKKDCKVHRLVALTFLPNPNDYECVNHIDGNKLNNSVSNLEWCSKGHNNRHARTTLGIDYSPKPVVQMDSNGEVIALWRNMETAATITGCTAALIGACCQGTAQQTGGYTWNFAGEEFSDFLKQARIKAINSQIERLQQELRQLS